MNYLLDTNVIGYFMRNAYPKLTQRVFSHHPDELFLSAITIMTSLLKGVKNMSVKEAKAFLTALKQKESDESLKEKAAAAKTKEERLSFFADTAREMGYDVSAEDISEALVQMQQEDIVVLEVDAMEDIAGGWKGAPHKRRGCPKNNYHPHKWEKTGNKRTGSYIGLFDDVEYKCKYCGLTEWFWR